MSNYERTRAEKIFWIFEKNIHNFFYHRPFLQQGALGWVLRQLGRPFRLYRHRIWNRFAYNKDGRMTNQTALRTLAATLGVLAGLAGLAWGCLAWI